MTKLIMLLLTTSFVCSAQAQKQQYDATNFDIAGVKLGMNKDEAVTALTTFLKVEESALRFPSYLLKDQILNRKIAKNFTYEADGVRVQVSMVAAIPIDEANPLRVNLITYETKRTDENMHSLRDKAFEKYGLPTNGVRENDHVSRKYSWCNFDTSIQNNSCFNAIGAKLELRAPTIQLSDPTYLKKIQKYMQNKNKAKVSF
ncbi:hypothetical protein [Marinicella sp. W31]|uniref:hypothetical protein n=1 Tax=Marinicella sp. W31 TaxID=3023713 RepID=UPI0037584815